MYCTVKITIFRNFLSRIYGTLCGPLEIPGGPLVVHLDHIEIHWFGGTEIWGFFQAKHQNPWPSQRSFIFGA